MTNDNYTNSAFEHEDGEQLISRYNEGTATPAERALVESWYIRTEFKDNLDNGEQLLKDQVNSRELLVKHMNPGKTGKKWSIPGTRWAAVAAAAVVLVALSVYLFNPFAEHSFHNDIAPGAKGATLIFANGKRIELNGAKNGVVIDPSSLTYDDGSTVDQGAVEQSLEDKKASSLQLTAATARGFTYALTLSDGTKVWLNAATIIKFPVSFTGLANRTISLNGEAYFEVAKDKKHPFIVESAGQKVQVLGTHFNINSYEDEVDVKTTLLEGSIKVSAVPRRKYLYAGKGDNVILKPGQQAVLVHSGSISVEEVEINEALDWKNGDFIFDRESLAHIMKRVARWYNVEVIYEPGLDVDQTFGGKVSRSKNISAVLKSIQSTGKIKFRIEGNKVIAEAKNSK